jgi:hypothetical protein
MTEVTLTLPDDLVQQAQRAGLLQPKAMETLLREVIREQAGERLRALMDRMPRKELTPEIEQEIVAEVKAPRQTAQAATTKDRR